MEDLIVVYDSCVLYPAPLRDLLMNLARTGLFQAKWTEEIHREWMRGLLRNRPDLTLERLERTRQLMNEAVRDCIVTGYEQHIERVVLPDAEDRHVVGAAIEAKASLIITFNLTDFPAAALSQFGLRAEHPDEFVRLLIELEPILATEAAERHWASLRKPAKTREQYLATLLNQGLKKTVAALEDLLPS
ncbi:MAG: PIN domain-containing protein [Blastocatellia bacterium]